MFGGGSSPAAKEPKDPDAKSDGSKSPSPDAANKAAEQPASGDKRSGNGSPPGRQDTGGSADKKRRASGVQSKASSLLASAKNTLNFSQVRSSSESTNQSPLQKLGQQDPALAVPQGQHNNSAGESVPGPRSTFQVGVWEDRNRKCRRTMEDTHAFLYNFLQTPAPALASQKGSDSNRGSEEGKAAAEQDMVETDNGYFAIFDGHAGTFAADWCGKKLHIILEDTIRRNPNMPIPELLDQTFTAVDAQLEKLPVKNSGCTAAIAVLRWEERVPSDRSATGSQAIAPATAAASKTTKPEAAADEKSDGATTEATHAKLKNSAFRQRVLYTANVGDARIILCRAGKALRLSYDHKGSDENEGKRIVNAGGLILNNRVNGVLAVTRALGDAYIKDLVTGHPYTTETVIHPESDEFLIIACDGLWDVCSDQEAVDLIRETENPDVAAKNLVDHALNRFSTDNLSCMVVRFDKDALIESQNNKDSTIGIEQVSQSGRVSEADKILRETEQKISEGNAPATGVSAANNAPRGRDGLPSDQAAAPTEVGSDDFTPTTLDGAVEEEPSSVEGTGDPTKAVPDPVAATKEDEAAKTNPS